MRLKDLGVPLSTIKDLRADIKRLGAANTNATVLPPPASATEMTGHAWMALTLNLNSEGRYRHMWERPGYEYESGRWKITDPNEVVANAMLFLHNNLAEQLKGTSDKAKIDKILTNIQMVTIGATPFRGV